MSEKLRIAIVVGEASGDMLGVSLMRAIRALHPNVEFEGIGGTLMCEEGFNSLYPMERLSVMGFIEPLKRLPELFRIKSGLVSHFSENRPDVFIGIDSPDFNLRVEKPLRDKGIACVHYVSPSVWAWRQGRIESIRKAVDMVLCLLPFEADFYRKKEVPVAFVGHPMADEIPLSESRDNNKDSFRAELGFSDIDISDGDATGTIENRQERKLVALLPGSRIGEIEKIAPTFIAVADQLLSENLAHRFLIPAASEKVAAKLTELIAGREHIELFHGQSRQILGASDCALVASGTATLEAMLMKCPMVVAYKVDRLTYAIGKRLVKVPHISLANLIAGKALVTERIQDEATIETLCADTRPLLADTVERKIQLDAFYELHTGLRLDASRTAANAVLQLIKKNEQRKNKKLKEQTDKGES